MTIRGDAALWLAGWTAVPVPQSRSCAPLLSRGAMAHSGGAAKPSARVLKPHGIGAVRFGTAKLKTVAELSHLFGSPRRGVSIARAVPATPRSSGATSLPGFGAAGSPGSASSRVATRSRQQALRVQSRSKGVSPKLAVSPGVTLGSTVAQLRAAYRRLERVGADMWRSADGLIFVDDAKRDPVPPTSRVIEIKIGDLRRLLRPSRLRQRRSAGPVLRNVPRRPSYRGLLARKSRSVATWSEVSST